MSSHQAETPRHEPYSIEIEQSALGSAIVANGLLDCLCAELTATDFYEPLHQRIFTTMVAMGTFSPLTLAEAMRGDEAMAEVGGVKYLAVLAGGSPALPDMAGFAKILKDLSWRRSLIRIGDEIVDAAYKPPSERPSGAITATATESLLRIGHTGSRPTDHPHDVAGDVLARAEAALRGEKPPAVPTGLEKIDKALGGLMADDCIFIPGRSGMGKTTLWCNIGLAAARAGHPVLLFSKEMPSFQITQWMLVNIDLFLKEPGERPIHHWKFRTGSLSNFEIQRLARARAVLAGLRLEICDDKSLTAGAMLARSRAFASRYKGELGLIGLDFLQNVEDDSAGKNDSREQIVSRLAYGQKRMAGMLQWPVISTVQLKNKGDGRTARDALPTADDIRESGAIEMAADSIFVPHRRSFFHKQKEPILPHESDEWQEWNTEMQTIQHEMWLRGFKNRHGDPSNLNVELWCDMGSAAIRDNQPRTWSHHE